MEDNRIVDLYWARNESAITETASKYGKYCYVIAYNILCNQEDADESVMIHTSARGTPCSPPSVYPASFPRQNHPARISEEMAGYPPGQAWRRRSVPCP
mgnify:CR=1 FL=1